MKTKTAERIKSLLSFDPIATAEKFAPSSGYPSADALSVSLAHVSGEHKKAVLKQCQDAYLYCPMEEFLSVVKSIGFKIVLKLPVPNSDNHLYVLWRKDGIMIRADSYDAFDGHVVNSAYMCFNFVGKERPLECSGAMVKHKGKTVFIGHTDVRDAVKFRIAEMEKDGKFLSKWIEQPFMWLLHYQDTKVQFYDSGKINRERIKLLPRNVRRAIDPRSFWEMLRDAVRTIFHKA